MTTTASSLPPSLPPRGADIQDDVADLQDGERDLQDKKVARVQLMPNRCVDFSRGLFVAANNAVLVELYNHVIHIIACSLLHLLMCVREPINNF